MSEYFTILMLLLNDYNCTLSHMTEYSTYLMLIFMFFLLLPELGGGARPKRLAPIPGRAVEA